MHHIELWAQCYLSLYRPNRTAGNIGFFELNFLTVEDQVHSVNEFGLATRSDSIKPHDIFLGV